ncbi:MAG: 50S ribosomal protein L25/general stress protein Ctc [Alphaproteobacteria bacterium]|nr:50S ribosomal protein L25/general stress protein Ctc [Alphaproteobacteria bacterium]
MSIQFKAEKREQLGKSSARKIKNAGRIPAIIYSDKGNVNLSLDAREFEGEYLKGNLPVSVIELELAGKKVKVIAHKIELDPVSDRPVHVDFLGCADAKAIRAKPRLVFINQEKSPGLKKGGVLNIVLRRVEVVCEGEKSIPEKIEVDIGALHISNKVRAADLKLPSGVKLVKKDNFLVASITGRGKSEEEKAAATPEAGAATPAAGGATPAKADEKKAEAAKKPEAKK